MCKVSRRFLAENYFFSQNLRGSIKFPSSQQRFAELCHNKAKQKWRAPYLRDATAVLHKVGVNRRKQRVTAEKLLIILNMASMGSSKFYIGQQVKVAKQEKRRHNIKHLWLSTQPKPVSIWDT